MTRPAGPPFLNRWVVVVMLVAALINLVASLAMTHWADAGSALAVITLALDWLMTEPTRRI